MLLLQNTALNCSSASEETLERTDFRRWLQMQARGNGLSRRSPRFAENMGWTAWIITGNTLRMARNVCSVTWVSTHQHAALRRTPVAAATRVLATCAQTASVTVASAALSRGSSNSCNRLLMGAFSFPFSTFLYFAFPFFCAGNSDVRWH